MTNKEMVNFLGTEGILQSPSLINAFEYVDRADFVSDEYKGDAYINAPLPIGYGQTISQPWTVAFMLELLQPQCGEKILDIGSGSGWQTALLATVVSCRMSGAGNKDVERQGATGRVFGLEVIKELHKQSVQTISKYNFLKSGVVTMLCMSAQGGLPQEAPFDKIICAARLQKIPQAWKDQLKAGGRLVTPVGSSVFVLTKRADGSFETQEHYGFAFVPFVS